MRFKLSVVFLFFIILILFSSNKIKKNDEKILLEEYKGIFKEYVIEEKKDNIVLRNLYKTKNYKLQKSEYGSIISINMKEILMEKNNLLSLKTSDEFKETKLKFIKFLGDSIIVSEKGKFGLIDTELNQLIPNIYDALIGDDKSNILIAQLGDKIGYISKNNKLVAPFIYENGAMEKDGVIVVKKNNKIGVINLESDTVLDFNYDAIYYDYNKNFIVKDNNKYYSVNKDEKKEIDASWLGIAKDNHIFYEKDGKFGIMKLDGKKITENYYDELSMNYNNLIIAKIQNKYGLINNTGETIIPFKYDYITPISEYFFEAGIDEISRIEILDYDGKSILNDNFDFLLGINKSYLIVEKFNSKMIFNRLLNSFEEIDELISYNNDLLAYRKKNEIFIKKIK